MKLKPVKKSSVSQQMDDNMVPLINVVFLMLIFFMVAGQIKKADPVDIIPPASINETRPDSDANVVVVVQDNQVYADDELIEVDKLSDYLAEHFAAAGGDEHFWVQVKADADTTIDSLKPIFAQIKASGLTKVSLATQLLRDGQ